MPASVVWTGFECGCGCVLVMLLPPSSRGSSRLSGQRPWTALAARFTRTGTAATAPLTRWSSGYRGISRGRAAAIAMNAQVRAWLAVLALPLLAVTCPGCGALRRPAKDPVDSPREKLRLRHESGYRTGPLASRRAMCSFIAAADASND
jgi:hypothetical protein